MARRSWWRVSTESAAVVAVGGALLLSACGPSAANATPSVNVDGHAYAATSGTGIALPATGEVRLVFDGFTLHETGGCNQLSGDYRVADGFLTVQRLSQTMMGCESALERFDAAMTSLLTSTPRVRLDGERLILTAGSVTLVLQETTAPSDLPLMGTTWVVVGVGSGDSIRHDNGGAPATVRLHDGRADVFDGCNIGTGTAVVEGNVVRFSELDRTKKACDPTAELLEYSVVMVLQGDVTARVEGRSLVLASGDHSLLLEAADS